MGPAQIADYEGRIRAVRGSLHAVVRDMTSESSDQLFTAAKLVGQLQEHPGWDALVQMMEARKARIFTTLVHGQTPEKHEFAALLSMVSGIEQVLLAGDVLKEFAAEKVRALEDQARSAGEEQS